MKWYHVIGHDNAVDDPYVADTGDLMGVEGSDLWKGRLISNWNDGAWIQARKPGNDGDPDDALQSYLPTPVYSARLRKALSDAGIGGIQYLPLHILRSDGSEISGYAIANVLNLVSGALNLEQSDYEVFPPDYFLTERVGRVRALRIPVLYEAQLEGLDAVRLAEYMSPLYVSERFKETFEKAGCTGHSFTEIEIG